MLLLLTLLVIAHRPIQAQSAPDKLSEASLEDLLNVEVTSVSKKEQRLSETAAAVYVLTREEIRRSGATSLPELLRLVPGVNVARIDGNKWAISARGFNGRFANKLLVLIDGRSVYTPLFSGVFWDVQDLMLEDVERIEVIRGPGATMWGANAVNGVINIITRHSSDTQGGLVVAGTGTEERGFGSIRFGGQLGDEASYRIYGKYFNRSGQVDAAGRETADQWHALRGGFRLDWQTKGKDAFTLQGDIYQGNFGQTSLAPVLQPPYLLAFDETIRASGGNILGRWDRAISDRSQLSVKAYFDRTRRDESAIGDARDTLDIDFQHHVKLGGHHDVVWGADYRRVSDNIRNTFYASFNPAKETYHLFSGFAQDEITLVKDRLNLTIGSKFESNSYTGFNVQPNARLAWNVSHHQTLWAAVSRAARTPSRFEYNGRVNYGVVGDSTPAPPVVVGIIGDKTVRAETQLAYEAGYRVQPLSRLSLDFALFNTRYKEISSAGQGQPFFEPTPLPPHVVAPLNVGNFMKGAGVGGEVVANLTLTNRWKLNTWYAHTQASLKPIAGLPGQYNAIVTNDSPKHQWSVRSYLSLPRGVEFDTGLTFVDRVTNIHMPSYWRLDARVGWRVTEAVEVSFGAQNLLDNHHPEFTTTFNEKATEVRRSAYGKVTWHF